MAGMTARLTLFRLTRAPDAFLRSAKSIIPGSLRAKDRRNASEAAQPLVTDVAARRSISAAKAAAFSEAKE